MPGKNPLVGLAFYLGGGSNGIFTARGGLLCCDLELGGELLVHGESLQLANLAPWFLKAAEADALPFFIGLLFAFEALAFAQAAVGFVLGSSVSFVVLMSYLICSAYARHWALLGNALMLLRWGGIVKEGIAAGSSVLSSIGLMSLCLSLGGLWFRRADLIEKGDKI